jgi:hypothetical protein
VSVITASAPATADAWIVRHLDPALVSGCPLQHGGIRRQFGRARDGELEVEADGGVNERRDDVVAVAGPGQPLAPDRALDLLEGHDVGHDLAGMRAVGETIDHRHGGMCRQLEELLVGVGANHDEIDVAGKHGSGIGHGLAPPQLHLLALQDDCATAELPTPTSNDTRVRVEGFSKIRATVLPVRGRPASLPDFIATA